MVRRLLSLPPIFSLFPTTVWLPVPPVPLTKLKDIKTSRVKLCLASRPSSALKMSLSTSGSLKTLSRLLKSTSQDTGAPMEAPKYLASKSPLIQVQACLTLQRCSTPRRSFRLSLVKKFL
ncbi:hypothetical protein DFH06DRAFT_1342809 [Mycena polygramma]|nr:hypothetical protein DFH06DRAFT_1342809 [Mycena polygramma]